MSAKPTPKTKGRRRLRRPPANFAVLIAAGRSMLDIAMQIGTTRETVTKWRDLPETQAEVERIRAEQGDLFRERLRSLVDPSIGVLEGVLRGKAPVTCPSCAHTFDAEVPVRIADQLRAVEMTLERAGLPRREIHEHAGSVSVPARVDLSNLSAEQLAALTGATAPAEGPPAALDLDGEDG